MIAQLLSFSFITLSSFITGALVKRVTKWNISFYYDFFIGFAYCNACFTLISLFHPVNDKSVIIFISILSLLFVANIEWIRTYAESITLFIKKELQNKCSYLLPAAIFIVISFCQSLYKPTLHYDAGLYHIQSIKWTIEYPAVNGLVHLNPFFGYNFNIFTLFAASSLSTLFKQPIYAVNFTIICFFTLWLFSKLADELKAGYYLNSITILLILYCLMVYFWPHISTTSNDTLVFILLMSLLISMVQSVKNYDILYVVFILSIYAITIKLSAVPILILALYISCIKEFWSDKKKMLTTLSISALILMPWLLKNIILTGWVLFPVPYFNIYSFDWQLPVEEVVNVKQIIKNFSLQNNNNSNNNNSKTINYLLSQSMLTLFVMATTLIMLIVLLLKLINKKSTISNLSLVTLLACIVGILFIFFNSPSLRYGIAFFLGVISLSAATFKVSDKISKYTFYLTSISLVVVFLKGNWFHPWHMVKNISTVILVPYPISKSELKTFNTYLIDNRVPCYYPSELDQCFDQTLPCTLKQVKGLHLRGKTIEQGFYIANTKLLR